MELPLGLGETNRTAAVSQDIETACKGAEEQLDFFSRLRVLAACLLSSHRPALTQVNRRALTSDDVTRLVPTPKPSIGALAQSAHVGSGVVGGQARFRRARRGAESSRHLRALFI
jgi:hypothetical protein